MKTALLLFFSAKCVWRYLYKLISKYKDSIPSVACFPNIVNIPLS